MKISEFRREVWKYWRKHGRHDLPWRKTSDPYRILVSEVMLQQTQVLRVIEKYEEFLKKFPTVRALARAPFADVLKIWIGLGYNRRARYLHQLAQVVIRDYKGIIPKDVQTLRRLPGIGPYTAAAVLIFAYNIPDTMIETNIRAAFIHFFFKDSVRVHDRELLPLTVQAAQGQDPREWHWALMDYGAHIKRTHPNPSRKSTHHVKQSRFEGSIRQVRGAILRELNKGRFSLKSLPFPEEEITRALKGLEHDGMINRTKTTWKIV